MTIEQLIAQAESAIKRSQAAIDSILGSAKQAGRSNLSEVESRQVDRYFGEIDIERGKLAEYRAIKADEDEYKARVSQTVDAPLPQRQGRTATVSVISEARTYHKGNDPQGLEFIRDVLRAQVIGDPKANERLARHMDEERVERGAYLERAGDIATSGMGGLVVPQYLVEMTAPAAAARRPFADACNRHVLPDQGMSLTIPLVSQATGVALQTENTAVQDTAFQETDLTLAVKTAAGMQSISRQAVDRGRVDQFVLEDLFARSATVLDNELINGATTGLDAKAVGAAASATTMDKVYPAILGRQSAGEAALLGGVVDTCVMHSRRWAHMSSSLVSTWPFVNDQGEGPGEAGLIQAKGYGSNVRGTLPNGMKVVVDNNIATNKGVGTNEDVIYVVPSLECHLWESPNQPAFIRAEQPLANQLSVLLVVYSYFAYTFARYASAMGKVTGLTAPTF